MKYIYTLAGLIFIIISIIGLKKNFDCYNVAKNGNIKEMIISEIPGSCPSTRISYFMKVEYKNKKYLKRIGGNFCGTHSVGDKINMKYIEGSENIMFPNESEISEFISGSIMLLFGTFLFLKGLGFIKSDKSKNNKT